MELFKKRDDEIVYQEIPAKETTNSWGAKESWGDWEK